MGPKLGQEVFVPNYIIRKSFDKGNSNVREIS